MFSSVTFTFVLLNFRLIDAYICTKIVSQTKTKLQPDEQKCCQMTYPRDHDV